MQVIKDFLDWGSRQLAWTNSTVAGYRSHVSQLFAWYNQEYGREATPEDLTHSVCEAWLVSREKSDKRPRTRYSGVSAVRAFGRYCVEHDLLRENPGAKLRLPRLDKPNQKSCTEAQKEALMDAATRRLPTAKTRALAGAILGVFVYAGLRRFELVALNVSDLVWDTDARRSKLIVRIGKGRKRREIPINSALAGLLRNWLNHRQAPQSQPALWIGIAGRRLTDYSLGQLLGSIKTAAGLEENPDVSPHGFRHYFATSLDRAGVPLPEVSKLLGHSDLLVTLSYLQCDNERLYEAVERLSVPSSRQAEQTQDNRVKASTGKRKPGWRRR